MNKNLLLGIGIAMSLLSVSAHAQKSCGFDAYHEEQLRNNPAFKSRLASFEKFWQDKQELLMNSAERVVVNGTDTTYEIPVVFHIIHTGSAVGTNFNPTDAHIQSVVDYLNQSYAATWPGYATTSTGGTNIPLRFVLAKRDPSCNATTGINRINGVTTLGGATGTTYDSFGVRRLTTNGITDAQLKGIIQWSPANYYNIWVVNKIDGWSGYVAGSGVVGYAQFAGGTPASDGTVIMEAFNDAGETTLPHELGHAFNLYHTFQGGCDTTSCATTGDMVCDTDPHAQVSGCPTGTNPCTGTSWLPVTYNIMNYTNCTDRFSAGQNARVKAAIFSQRGSLINSLGGTVPGGQTTYATPVALASCTTPGITNAGNNNDIGPEYIKISDLQSFSDGYTGDGYQVYLDHTAPTCGQAAIAPANMTSGQTYAVSVATGFNPENVRIYIDFNNNGTFNTPAETVFTSNGIAGDQYRVHTGNTIAIPATGVTFNTPLRMRVISDFYGNNAITPCGGNLQYGQVEDFSVIITNTPLAVTLTKITASVAGDKKSIDVQWSVEKENDAEHYEIERSLNGKTFSTIGKQIANAGQTEYLFNDAAAARDQVNFYRLKMVGKDQKSTYSKTVSASINGTSGGFNVYPNPASNVLNIAVPANGVYEVTITNELGQAVYTKQNVSIEASAPAQISLKEAAFAAGIYYLKLTEKSGLSYNGKFLKQ